MLCMLYVTVCMYLNSGGIVGGGGTINQFQFYFLFHLFISIIAEVLNRQQWSQHLVVFLYHIDYLIF